MNSANRSACAISTARPSRSPSFSRDVRSPEYCPRLSKNFQEASKALLADATAPTNWHLLSISFDPFDTPAVLRAYGKSCNYDSNHWSFLTGPHSQMTNLAYRFGVKISGDPGNYAHG